ncbi:type I DNA topoisomerase [Coralliovum pocilloporae]|uniref:type I DNA topoisomerase n=1 Tax=Coralliovum pocilloporae TaxID=3066369 RepID=UPI00330757E2
MDVVIVESPAKAKTINKYLGSNYQVLASYGHVRDLPAKDGSVRPDDSFSMSWELDSKSKKRMSDITAAVKKADRLILATDPDREGEAISWHVLQVLNEKKALKDRPVQRVVFNAITKQAVTEAMNNPRDIDSDLVDAYLARRALDYLVGFTLSPVLWRKLPGARSAGRVQSVALRLVCDREREIETFLPQEYWSILATLKSERNAEFEARVVGLDGKKLGRQDIPNGTQASEIEGLLNSASFTIAAVEAKPQKRNPQPPFTTSTMQQEASRKLGFAAARTMQVAQRLYEGISIGGETVGLITYMRTDGVQIAPEAVQAARSTIAKSFGDRYLPEKPRHYHTKAKNAQEAHEAIRPTDMSRHPKDVASYLDADQARLYELVWKRTIASQMASALLERTTADINATASGRTVALRANGSVLKFDGFLTLYQEGKDDEQDEDSKRLPELHGGETASREKVTTSQHFTEPPPRYTEATLIKKMEELGIGRPSTYTATLSVLQDRGYVEIDKKRLIPHDKGRIVTAFLESFFERYVQYDFTAGLEEQLDAISAGDLDWRAVLGDFWQNFSASVDDIKELRVTHVLDALNDILAAHIFPEREDGSDPRSCPTCDDGRLSLKLSRYGSFIGCSNYPDCRYTRQLSQSDSEAADADNGPKILGQDPASGEDISLRTGRFGPYVQIGEEAKPKRASIPKGWSPDSIDLEKALSLLSLPREVGLHPESGQMISAGIGRYGPFVQHEKTYANLPSVEDVFTVGLNHAVTLIAEKLAKGGRGRGAAQVLKELGDHPDGGAITVKDGRYGPYVNHGKVNATLPKDSDPQAVTLEQALELIAAKSKTSKSKTTKSKTAAKKTTAKKTTRTKKTAS